MKSITKIKSSIVGWNATIDFLKRQMVGWEFSIQLSCIYARIDYILWMKHTTTHGKGHMNRTQQWMKFMFKNRIEHKYVIWLYTYVKWWQGWWAFNNMDEIDDTNELYYEVEGRNPCSWKSLPHGHSRWIFKSMKKKIHMILLM